MMIKLIIIIEIILLFFGISFLYSIYKKKEKDIETRFNVLEKRIEDLRQLLKNYNHGILNNIDIHDKHYNEYFAEINNRFKNLEKKVSK